MVRTHVRLTEPQIEALRRLSAATGQSIAELIRQGVDQIVAVNRQPSPAERRERAKQVAGRFRSGQTDVSANHDRRLAEIFGE